jgi:hypothetical protein
VNIAGRTVTVLKFGKYAGSNIRNVPCEYLEFLLGSATTIETCKAELERRAVAGGIEDDDARTHRGERLSRFGAKVSPGPRRQQCGKARTFLRELVRGALLLRQRRARSCSVSL